MAVKSKAKPKTKAKVKTTGKAGKAVSQVAKKEKTVKRTESKIETAAPTVKVRESVLQPAAKQTVAVTPKVAPKRPSSKTAAVVKRVVNPILERRRPIKRSLRSNQFSFMKAPGSEHIFEVGDIVEVFCDHEKSRERIRGWVKGIVVQVDNKLVAVQFRSNVYLTDGWMVPDRILWFPVTSEHIRPGPGKKTVKKDFIPEY